MKVTQKQREQFLNETSLHLHLVNPDIEDYSDEDQNLICDHVINDYFNNDMVKKRLTTHKGNLNFEGMDVRDYAKFAIGHYIKTLKPKKDILMKQNFTIPVTRIGYAYKNIEVNAESQTEAEEIALDIAGDEEFSERESEYVLPESAGDETHVVKVILGEDACRNFSHIESATNKDEIVDGLANEYGEEEVASSISEMAMGIQTFTFKTKAEADAFTQGITTATGYLEGAVFSKDGHALASLIESMDS